MSVSSSGFVSTNRANLLAQKIVAADIALGNDDTITFYSADNCAYLFCVFIYAVSSIAYPGAFLNDTEMSASYDYIDPSLPFTVNAVNEPTSQRFHVSRYHFGPSHMGPDRARL